MQNSRITKPRNERESIFTITLSNFKINAIIGILPSERENPQEIILNLSIIYDKNLGVLDYSVIYEKILEIFKQNNFDYLENAIDIILERILGDFSGILQITLNISKPKILPFCIPSVSKTIKRECP